MKVFSDKFADFVLTELSHAPESHVSRRIAHECSAIMKRCATLAEKYEFLAEIRERSCCETSSFVKALCDVRRYYVLPEETAAPGGEP